MVASAAAPARSAGKGSPRSAAPSKGGGKGRPAKGARAKEKIAELSKAFATDEIEEKDLVYVSDQEPGIRRKGTKDRFRYVYPDGTPVRDTPTLARIKSLAIPPAWIDVWICTERTGHLQATGRDAKNRKQYRYHRKFRESRERAKYEHVIAFGEALPAVRRRVEHDLSLPGLPRDKVLATVVRLLETTLIRVGNEEYAKANRSFGLTTLRTRHVGVEGTTLRFEFRGKSGVKHKVTMRDRRLARVVNRLQELPGQELFQYIDEEGERRHVTSADVNAYLREATGADFTAKDYRTWAGTVLASLALQEVDKFGSGAEAKRELSRVVESVARQLGNTPAICRKCYIHPHVLEEYLDGTLADALSQRAEEALQEAGEGLRPEERAVLALLRSRLQREAVE